jgi:hypothetical protein
MSDGDAYTALRKIAETQTEALLKLGVVAGYMPVTLLNVRKYIVTALRKPRSSSVCLN